MADLNAVTAVPQITALRIEDEDTLDLLLQKMNWEEGVTPVVVGIDAQGMKFLAYGWAPGGDGWKINVTTDDTHSSEFSYTDIEQCEDCGAHDRLPVSFLHFPLVVI